MRLIEDIIIKTIKNNCYVDVCKASLKKRIDDIFKDSDSFSEVMDSTELLVYSQIKNKNDEEKDKIFKSLNKKLMFIFSKILTRTAKEKDSFPIYENIVYMQNMIPLEYLRYGIIELYLFLLGKSNDGIFSFDTQYHISEKIVNSYLTIELY